MIDKSISEDNNINESIIKPQNFLKDTLSNFDNKSFLLDIKNYLNERHEICNIVTKDDLYNLFSIPNTNENIEINDIQQNSFGPRIFIKPIDANYSEDSLDNEIYANTLILNLCDNNSLNAEDVNKNIESEPDESHKNSQIVEMEERKEIFNPPKNDYHYTLFTNININTSQISTLPIKQNYKNFKCFLACFTSNNTTYKKRLSVTSLYSVGNNVTQTKRSSNISLKSIKNNDSLIKYRKKKRSKIGEIKVNEDNSCRCIVF
jgi:hypothetical protein